VCQSLQDLQELFSSLKLLFGIVLVRRRGKVGPLIFAVVQIFWQPNLAFGVRRYRHFPQSVAFPVFHPLQTFAALFLRFLFM
jgi:hypothetical protein